MHGTDHVLTRSVSRRTALGGAAALGLGAALARVGLSLAQDATPGAGGSDFASLGYPELKVTITETGYEGIPDSLPAGRYLLTATAQTSAATPSPDQQPPTVAFVSPTPAGMKAADFVRMFASAPQGAASPEAMGSPEAMSSPAAGGGQGGDQQLPLEVYQMKFAGGVMVFPGQQSGQAVIDLTAGEWVAWSEQGTLKPVTFTVTGELPTDLKEPEADITATLVDFAITLEGALTAGPHVIKIQHHGAQPHFLEMQKGPDTMTKAQVEATLQGEMTGTPVAGGLDESALQPVFYSPTQSIGTTTWRTIGLSGGTFLAACFFPTAGTGVPHAMNGMVDVFKVS